MGRWQNGDDSAFGALYKRHAYALLGIASYKTGDREKAKELVQETFISLCDHRDQISPATPLRAFLYATLKHKLLNEVRRTLNYQKHENYYATLHPVHDDTTQALLASRELEQLMEEQIGKLPPQCQRVFRLSRQSHLTNKEIAAQLDISENTVEQHMRKALRLLRSSLGQFIELGAIIYLLHRP
ncbi:RNA polymerase sigma-70 factor [Mucilaginibacter gracilis]|uniref:RNA polymerase sigma-70 factor n=1 Tax=Mucilaginibacter gracilis TaxID=423350 RepID=UPI0021D2F108|nr:RNA polymerase sigma-70 factor [Mucilaginibacter gracilis]